MSILKIKTGLARAFALVFASSFAVAACTSSVDSGQGGGTASASSASFEAACAKWAKGSCDSQRRCVPYFFAVDWKDSADCEAREKLGCNQYFAVDGANVDPSDLEACAETFAGSCDEGGVGPACQFKGSRPDHSGCFSDAQCAGTFCWFDYSCLSDPTPCSFPTCGVCLAPRQLGQLCKPGQCDAGLVCDDGGSCVTPAKDGARCKTSTVCGGSFSSCVDGTCHGPAGLGESCKTLQCDFDAGLTCDFSTFKCVKDPIVGVGQSCASDSNSLVSANCGRGSLCNQTSCVAVVADGGACEELPGGIDNCAWPAHCAHGRCTLDAPSCN